MRRGRGSGCLDLPQLLLCFAHGAVGVDVLPVAYDHRLYNYDIAPSKKEGRTWSSYNIFALWANDVHSLGNYTFAIGMFALGLGAWQILLAMGFGSLFLLVLLTISGFVGYKVGVPFPATLWPWDDLMQTYQVVEDVTTKVYSGKKTKTYSQKLVVKKGKKPTKVWVGGDSYNCPKGYPVKGNADSGIYHVPGGRFYSRTKPEECFSSASAARAAGYRASRAG